MNSTLCGYGWDSTRDADFAPHAARGLVPARVVRVHGTLCDAVTEDGLVRADLTPVTSPDPLAWVCTGDWAALDPSGDPVLVRELLPRRTTLVRNTSSKRSEGQVLAANVDTVVIAVSIAAELDLGRVERFLALAWESGAQPVVALTKADLVPEVDHLVTDVATVAPGAPVFAVSAATGSGLEPLAGLLGGGTCVLLGQSGAGKSTLANALLGREAQDVRAVRDADGKGRHTTTSRDLLPLPGGGVVIDTPGLRGVGMWDAESGVGRVFTEIEALAADCRFHDCAHVSEPGCAVLSAVAAGTLPERRLDSYRKLLRENAWIAARTDVRLRAEQRTLWKRRSAEGRAAYEAKRGGRPW
ncbi:MULTISPECIES: ribosome small subunit-dependent GTPase A [Streptomycetaceae]|uniref:Small ribosomal subunit biogenesis GTPase RsgA n=1 Tax=Streptantibioticus cattleyicolor (strain ATCC 35852 / DSM 46488 / JCM 4925 / NBRC 14057 / NRRL 8057) TaxID=1003195 RepID=F8JWU4_STREN|nr:MULTISPECIES: ribosome small subunit-dependent GTPase A [Streptomycetaceae]AEW97103.1 putative ATP GTP-binding protein [Streptantibioticus cattleyicolor NRRL 8057 = DSM 46488]MYS61563.1 ribosome small subunit-dependent GTPase A [Streptomyces sp. SID5468]CCB77426.1 putative ribosome biogenesis GTPase rsgA [Streptantibioticus cattleyicolor NRRL 8057 = DSM 46488]